VGVDAVAAGQSPVDGRGQEEADVAEERHTTAFVVGAILGGLAGAGATLWKTPRSGQGTRALIAERAEGFLFRLTGMDEWQPAESGAAPASAGPATAPPSPHPTPAVASVPVGDAATPPDRLSTPPSDEVAAGIAAATEDEPALPLTFRGETLTESPADAVLDGPRPTPTDR
jgi:hypothetical protein